MKIAGCIIQNRNIKTHTKDEFYAFYKGKSINITTNHGFGKPHYDHLTRFMIDVIDEKTGLRDVNTYEDLHTVRDAIIYALKGSCLITKP
jgi:hypothetical protein